jgi:hypothetical protein
LGALEIVIVFKEAVNPYKGIDTLVPCILAWNLIWEGTVPASQKNFQLFTYVDDDGVSWDKRGELDAVRNAVDGSTAFGGNPVWAKESRRNHVRKIIYQDATTFRTKTCIFYTAAAYAAITLGTSSLSFPVEGEATAVLYVAREKISERKPGVGAARNLADHA